MTNGWIACIQCTYAGEMDDSCTEQAWATKYETPSCYSKQVEM